MTGTSLAARCSTESDRNSRIWGSGRNFDFCYCKLEFHYLHWFARV